MLRTFHTAASCTATTITLGCPVQKEIEESPFPLLKKVSDSVLELLDLPFKIRHLNRILKSAGTKMLISKEMNGTCRDYRNRRENRKRSKDRAIMYRRMAA